MLKSKNFKKLLSIALACVMLVVVSGSGLGNITHAKAEDKTYRGEKYGSDVANVNNAIEDDFNENDYEYLTFSVAENNSLEDSDITINNRSSQFSPNQGIINDAIEFVQNLKLSERGLAYLEEECLRELEMYKEENVELESYSVLVPKNSSGIYYGSSGGEDYYYDYISEVDYRIETKGRIKNSLNEASWGKWVAGAINVSASFTHYSISLPFSIISSIVGIVNNTEIHYGAYIRHVARFNNVKTKIIYMESHAGSIRANFSAQEGDALVQSFFCPVDINLPEFILIGKIYEGYLDRTDTFSKSYLLSYFPYANITGEVIDLPLGALSLNENWG